MMRLLTVLAIWATSLSLIAGGVSKGEKEKKNPADAFQGEWIVDSLRFAGYELRGTPEKPMMVSFTKSRMVTRPAYSIQFSSSFSFGQSGFKTDRSTTISLSERGLEATFRLDPKKTPGQIDLQEKDNDEVRNRKGIYRLKDDQVEICIGSSGRPTGFNSSRSAVLLRLKRKGKKD